jgi:ParB family chromosome partitioning protein
MNNLQQLALTGLTLTASAESTDEWYTPPQFLDRARAVLGEIDLDPASNPAANQAVKAARFYTLADDGLRQHWQGRVWLNPPYSAPGAWVDKLIAHYRAGDVTAAILLVSNSTDTRWFAPLFDFPICFVHGRINFWGRPGKSNDRGSVFVYLGPDVDRFQAVFAPVGAIVGRL